MDVFLSSIAVVLLLALLFVMRRNRGTSNRRPEMPKRENDSADTQFHAVSLSFASSACEAAKSMEGRRFLSGTAPRIPLPDCDVLECKCRFVHHKDRRKSEDRRNPYVQGFGGGDTGKFPAEQRKYGDRRDD
jgi:hypothetical protein